jgi:hypothetical protein
MALRPCKHSALNLESPCLTVTYVVDWLLEQAVAAGVTGEGVDDSLGEDGFDFSAFEDNDEGSFDDADGKAEL